MSVSIRFLGTAAFEIRTASGKTVLIDPYLDENAVSPYRVKDMEAPDLLVVTHAAYDHLGDTEAILRRFPGLPLICGADVRGYLLSRGIEEGRLCATPWGMMVEKAGVRVRPVVSMHWSYIQGPDGRAFSSTPLGVIVYADEDFGVYHAGDTTLFSDMRLIGEFYRPVVGLINVGFPRFHQGARHGADRYLTGEMDSREAAQACRWLGLEYAIPCHHDDPQLPEIQAFKALLANDLKDNPRATKPLVLAPGEAHVFP